MWKSEKTKFVMYPSIPSLAEILPPQINLIKTITPHVPLQNPTPTTPKNYPTTTITPPLPPLKLVWSGELGGALGASEGYAPGVRHDVVHQGSPGRDVSTALLTCVILLLWQENWLADWLISRLGDGLISSSYGEDLVGWLVILFLWEDWLIDWLITYSYVEELVGWLVLLFLWEG